MGTLTDSRSRTSLRRATSTATAFRVTDPDAYLLTLAGQLIRGATHLVIVHIEHEGVHGKAGIMVDGRQPRTYARAKRKFVLSGEVQLFEMDKELSFDPVGCHAIAEIGSLSSQMLAIGHN